MKFSIFEQGAHVLILHWIHKLCSQFCPQKGILSIRSLGWQKQGRLFGSGHSPGKLTCPVDSGQLTGALDSHSGAVSSFLPGPNLQLLLLFCSICPEVTSGSGRAATASDSHLLSLHRAVTAMGRTLSLPVGPFYGTLHKSGLTSMVLTGTPHPTLSRNLGRFASWVGGH